MTERPRSEFPGHADDNRRIWDANAGWWDDQIGEGNDFQTLLIEPATERLLQIAAGNMILDVACGAGRFARRMVELGARVVAFDYSAKFIERARERTAEGAPIEYRVLDAAGGDAAASLGTRRFDKAVCTMALIGQPEPQWFFHRPIQVLFRMGFGAGFVVDGIEEPGLPGHEDRQAGVRWNDMPEIPPVMVVRMKLPA